LRDLAWPGTFCTGIPLHPRNLRNPTIDLDLTFWPFSFGTQRSVKKKHSESWTSQVKRYTLLKRAGPPTPTSPSITSQIFFHFQPPILRISIPLLQSNGTKSETAPTLETFHSHPIYLNISHCQSYNGRILESSDTRQLGKSVRSLDGILDKCPFGNRFQTITKGYMWRPRLNGPRLKARGSAVYSENNAAEKPRKSGIK
jgi:hypothetical protein